MLRIKEVEPGPPAWIKDNVRSGMENYLIFEGVLLILIFFMLITTISGPYIGTYVKYVEDDTVYTEVPIWIVFVYMGSVSLFIGFLLKIPRLIKGMDPRLRLFSLVGLVVAGANMVGMTVLFLFWFGGLCNRDIGSIEPILLIVTICVSIIYLIFDWLVIQHGYKRHLPL